jgi:molybdenum cofactor guanylyltransferase
MTQHNPIYGLILAGGKSSRMGRDKAALHYYNNMPQVAYLAELIKPIVKEAFISVNKTQVGQPHLQGMRLILDQFDTQTPLNGILSAMKELPNACWLVVAVDMPHVSIEAINILINNRMPDRVATAFVSPVKGGADPLFALWEGSRYEQLKEFIELNQRACPRSVFKHFNGHLIESAVPDKVLSNINTPEEYSQTQQEIESNDIA